MAMSKRMPFAGYGNVGMPSAPDGPGAGLSKRTRTMSPMTSGGGQPGGGGGTGPRVPPASPLPADIDLTALMDGNAGSAPLTPGNADAMMTPTGDAGGAEGGSSPISTILQMILRGQGGRA